MEIEHLGQMVKAYLRAADRFINMLVATSDVAPSALLVPEMISRIAETLNYFLRHLTGPDRAKLSVSNRAKVRPPCTHFRCLCTRCACCALLPAVCCGLHSAAACNALISLPFADEPAMR
jgi:hypothetical protein